MRALIFANYALGLALIGLASGVGANPGLADCDTCMGAPAATMDNSQPSDGAAASTMDNSQPASNDENADPNNVAPTAAAPLDPSASSRDQEYNPEPSVAPADKTQQ